MQELKEQLEEIFAEAELVSAFGELTLTVDSANIIDTCLKLRDQLDFDTLVDLCGVDYLTYGQSEWAGDVSNSGFSRGRHAQGEKDQHQQFVEYGFFQARYILEPEVVLEYFEVQ